MEDILEYCLSEKRPKTGNDPLVSFLQDNQQKPVALNVKDVQCLDSLRLRTLLSAQIQWTENKLLFSIREMSKDFRSGLSRLGIPQNQFDFEEE